MLDINTDTWLKTRHKLRKAYTITEEKFPGVKLLDVICIVMPSSRLYRDESFPDPETVTNLVLGYQVLAQVNGTVVTTAGFWDEAVDMDELEVNEDALFRVSQWVTALGIIEEKASHKRRIGVKDGS